MYIGGLQGMDLRLRNRGGAAAAPPPPPSGLLTGLISYWKMDETSGVRVDSVTASGNDLTDNNTVTSAAGKVGNTAVFTRANAEWLSRADNVSLSTGDIDFTFAGWVSLTSKPSTGGVGMGIVGKWNTGVAEREHLIYWDETLDRFLFVVSANGTTSAFVKADTLGAPVIGTFYFVVGWHDATANTINIQANAGTVDSVAHSTGVRDGASNLTIGAYAGVDGTPLAATDLDGRVDELGFWKRVLTSTERTNLYNAGTGIAYPFTGVA